MGEPKGRYASRKNEAECRQFLEEDPNSGEVEAHRVFCKAYNEWIGLNPSRRYIMKKWVEHRRSCKGISERSERYVTTTIELWWSIERRTEEDDTSAADGFTVDHAVIKRVKKEQSTRFPKVCHQVVDLGRQLDYDLTNWEEHKVTYRWAVHLHRRFTH